MIFFLSSFKSQVLPLLFKSTGVVAKTVGVFKEARKAGRTKGLATCSLGSMVTGQELLYYFCHGTGFLAVKPWTLWMRRNVSWRWRGYRPELQSCVLTCSCWMKWPHLCSLSSLGTSSVQRQTTLIYSFLKTMRMTWRWRLCKKPSPPFYLFTRFEKSCLKTVYFIISKSFFEKD